VAIPDYQSLMRPVLEVHADSNPHPSAEVRDRIAAALDVTDDEQLSRPVDQDRLGGFGLGLLAGSFNEFAVDEGRSGADQGDEMGRVDRAPAVLC
jgi:hypothetical protein